MEEMYSPEIVEAMEKAQNSAWEADRRLRAAATDMAELLLNIKEELIGHHDTVDGPEGKPYPNWAMQLTDKIEKVLHQAGLE